MVDLQKGFPLLIQQYKALLKKNFILAWRHRRSTLIQLFSSLFFIFLLFSINLISKSSSKINYDDPEPLISPPIPPCEDKFFIMTPCYDFVWSGNGSARIRSVVSNIMANNPGRPISPNRVKSFRTPEEVDDWLFRDPMRSPGALHFLERSPAVISYGIQTNSTPVTKRGRYEDPTFKFQVPLQIAAEREIARSLIGDPKFSWDVGLKAFVHPSGEKFSTMETIGPTFFLAIAMFGFVFQMSSLVTEKELKLRLAMNIMGVYECAYWFSWLTWEALITFLSALFTVLFGMMFRLDFFLHNSFAVVFLLFFLFQLNMVSFSFLLSAFISKSSSSTIVGFCIFIIGFVTQLVTAFGFPYSSVHPKKYRILWSLFPPNLLAQALSLLSTATETPEDDGISWSARAKCPPSSPDCVLNIDGVYRWLLSTFILWFFLAIYFDNIIPNSAGVRKSLFYFLKPGYWTGKGGDKVEESGICSCTGSTPPVEPFTPDDQDVLEEENIVKKQFNEGTVDPNVAVQLRGLEKTYPGTTNIGCCKCKKTPPYHAVKGLWMNLAKNQLFCLLGPNGAGKTTTISCLTGIAPVTGGDALIYGHSIRSAVGMSTIRKMIGLCPQFDILWDSLTAEEHLHLFAGIKGLPPDSINSVVQDLLEHVKLAQAAKRRAGSYSGGMKRRVSVAIALIGDPKLVILDEPTTGMDPITRRHVWDIIEDAKKGRAIVLTTHSMEEADILSDRIAIMAKGWLRCIGTSIRLKSRFGTGFIANVSFRGSTPGHNVNGDAVDMIEPHHKAVKNFFKEHLNVVPKEENQAFLTFVIPHEKEEMLADFFAELQDRESEFGISDIQLGLTTLEEVFLNIAKEAELESAIAEGALVTLTLTSGLLIEIPKGSRFVGIPGTESAENPRGLMVEVYWAQDDSGNLCISGHSPETPIPPNVQPMLVHSTTPSDSTSGRIEPILGYIIDHNQIDRPILYGKI
ncbi:ABC transporter A family member 2-like [Telopea speciosissima]|uniref:ABC transporter A family member 2-like n=1 Tax=Telopea speciosissima TaxID=54955 RepID=UPI001CC52187|nr:ABC transporter A family member 2-like [Telopea speciosissima]